MSETCRNDGCVNPVGGSGGMCDDCVKRAWREAGLALRESAIARDVASLFAGIDAMLAQRAKWPGPGPGFRLS